MASRGNTTRQQYSASCDEARRSICCRALVARRHDSRGCPDRRCELREILANALSGSLATEELERCGLREKTLRELGLIEGDELLYFRLRKGLSIQSHQVRLNDGKARVFRGETFEDIAIGCQRRVRLDLGANGELERARVSAFQVSELKKPLDTLTPGGISTARLCLKSPPREKSKNETESHRANAHGFPHCEEYRTSSSEHDVPTNDEKQDVANVARESTRAPPWRIACCASRMTANHGGTGVTA